MNFEVEPMRGDIGREGNHTVHVIEREEDLTGEMLVKLLDCGEKTFVATSKERENVLKEIISRGGRIYYVLDSEERIVGYATSMPIQDPAARGGSGRGSFFSGDAVRRENRGQGIHRAMNQARIEHVVDEKKEFVLFATQNPNIEFGMRCVFEGMKERGDARITDFRIEFDKVYALDNKPITKERPSPCPDEEINKRYSTLDYENGQMFAIKISISYPKRHVGT